VIFHSDRGCQYSSAQFTCAATELGVRLSHGRKGQCWDNAVGQSFFATIKNELLEDGVRPTHAAVRAAIVDSIEGWYDTRRRSPGADRLLHDVARTVSRHRRNGRDDGDLNWCALWCSPVGWSAAQGRSSAASSAREETPSLVNTLRRWKSIVRGDRNSWAAASRLLRPCCTSSATCRS